MRLPALTAALLATTALCAPSLARAESCGQFNFPCYSTANRPSNLGPNTLALDKDLHELILWDGQRWNIIGLTLQYANLRFPTSLDDAPHGYPAGVLWRAPNGQVLQSQQSAAGFAVWAPLISVSSANYNITLPYPCDIGSPVGCYGNAKIAAGYTGNWARFIRAFDGTTLDIGFVGDSVDRATQRQFCYATSCRMTIWYDQDSANSRHNDLTASAVRKATTGSTSSPAALAFSDTSGVSAGLFCDGGTGPDPNSIGTHVGTVVSNTSVDCVTYDGPRHPITAASGVGFLFHTAPTLTENMVGTLPETTFDAPIDSRQASQTSRQEMKFPTGLSVTSNDFAVIFAGRAQQSINLGFFGLSAGGGNGAWFGCLNAACAIHYYTGSAWGDAFDGSKSYGLASVTPFVGWVNYTNGGTGGFNDVSTVSGAGTISMGGGVTLGGSNQGAIGSTFGLQNANSGSVGFSIVIVNGHAYSPADLLRVKAAVASRSGVGPQIREPHVHVIYDDQGQGSLADNLQDYPRQISDLYPGVRVTSMASTTPPGTAAVMCAYLNKLSSYVAPFVYPNLLNNVGIITSTPNGWGAAAFSGGSITTSISGGALSGLTVAAAGTGHGISGVGGSFALEISDGSATQAAIGFYTVDNTGAVTSVALSGGQGGAGYPNSVTHSLAFMWGAGSGATGTYTVNGSGVVTGVSLTGGGSGYVPGTYRLTFSGTPGTPARARYTVNAGGNLSGTIIDTAGSGYTVAPRAGGTAAGSPWFFAVPLIDPALEQGCHAQLWAAAKTAGFSLLADIIHPVSSGFDGIPGNGTYYQAQNAWTIANAPAAGVALVRLDQNPFFGAGYDTDPTKTSGRYDFTRKSFAAEAQMVMDAIVPRLKPF